MVDTQRRLWAPDPLADQADALCRYLDTCERQGNSADPFTIYKHLESVGGAQIDLSGVMVDKDDLMQVTYDELQKGWIHRLMQYAIRHPNGRQITRQPAIASHFLAAGVPQVQAHITAEHVRFSAESIDSLAYQTNDHTPQSIRILLGRFQHARETFIADTVDSADYLKELASLIRDGKAADWQQAIAVSQHRRPTGTSVPTTATRTQLLAALKAGRIDE